MYLAVRWVVHAVILWLVVLLGKKLGFGMRLAGWGYAFLTVFLLALVNAAVRPLTRLLLLPLNCLTFGLLGFFVNAAVIVLLSKIEEDGFNAGGFWGALYLSVMLAILGGMANRWLRPSSRKD